MASKILALLVVMIVMLPVMYFVLGGIKYLKRARYLLGVMILLAAANCIFSMFFLYFAYSIVWSITVSIELVVFIAITVFLAQKACGKKNYIALLTSILTGIVMSSLMMLTSMVMRLVSM